MILGHKDLKYKGIPNSGFIFHIFNLKKSINGLTIVVLDAYIWGFDDNVYHQDSSVAQWQSMRLLTAGLLVRVQPGELIKGSNTLINNVLELFLFSTV